MEKVRGVMVALYKEAGDNYRFAVLRRERNWEGREFVKGRVEDGEGLEEAARREVEEETGIEPVDVKPLEETYEWEYERDGTRYRAVYRGFLAKAPSDALIRTGRNDEEEHSKGHFLNVRDSEGILTHDNQRDLMETALQQLEK